mgnify:CR=1 FL=1
MAAKNTIQARLRRSQIGGGSVIWDPISRSIRLISAR